MARNNILVIIPAYNEAGNIESTIKEVRSFKPEADILVVDDGSLDETALLAKKAHVDVVSLAFNLGIGSAVQAGLQYARKYHYRVAVRIDADGQHDPEYIETLLHPVREGHVDLVVGSRFLAPFLGYRSSFIRRVGIQFFATLISFLIKDKITDPTSGFQAFSQKSIELFAEDYPSDFPEPESIIVAKRAGLDIREVPVKMRKRVIGRSSIRYLVTLYYMIKVTFALCLDMIKKRKVIESHER